MPLSLYSSLLVQMYHHSSLNEDQKRAVSEAFEQENPNQGFPEELSAPDLKNDADILQALKQVALVVHGKVLTDQDLDQGKLPGKNDLVFLRRNIPDEKNLTSSLDQFELQEARASNALFIFQRLGEYDMDDEKLKNALQFLARYEARREQKQQHDVDLQSRPRKHLN